MYAIAFDFETDALKKNYPGPSYQNAYGEVRKHLAKFGFTWQQGSVYFGDETVNAVVCVMAAIDVAQTFPWFSPAVRDIRMLRIEEENNLMPAVERGASQVAGSRVIKMTGKRSINEDKAINLG